MLLAIETSGMQGSIAIFDGRTLQFERILGASGARHAQTLPAEVADVLARCNLQPRSIRSVAVSIGPGSFTGLRIGLTFAKTFAWLNDARLVADFAKILAEEQSRLKTPLLYVSDTSDHQLMPDRIPEMLAALWITGIGGLQSSCGPATMRSRSSVGKTCMVPV